MATTDSVSINPCSVSTDVAEFPAVSRAANVEVDAAARRKLLMAADQPVVGELAPDCYDEWILGERSRLSDLHVSVVSRLMMECEKSGEIAQAVAAYIGRSYPLSVTAPGSPTPSSNTPGQAIPPSPSRFFGREQELEDIGAMLCSLKLHGAFCDAESGKTQKRIVTITGSGGVGKTRLALEAAHRMAPGFSGHIVFVPQL